MRVDGAGEPRADETRAAMPVDYARLVGYCAYLTGDTQAAEDIAQDTLVEAWRLRHRMERSTTWDAWLFGIARNMCRRWAAARRRERHYVALPRPGESAIIPDLIAEVADTVDLEADLERAELSALVEDALALLPPDTRAVLAERYLHGTSQAVLAARMGMSEGAVEARLHRGKTALRRALAATLREEAQGYGLVTARDVWEDTRLWCPLCGRRRLEGQLDSASGVFALRCPECYPTTGVHCMYQSPDLFTGVRGYKPALGRVMRWANAFYRPALELGTAPCPGCGRPLPLRREQAPSVIAEMPDARLVRGVHVYCEQCNAACSMRLSNLTLYLPQAWQFWRAHQRLLILPDRDVEMDGQDVIVTRLQSLTGAAYMDVIAARDTFKVLRMHDATGV